eukprot:4412177-Pleurochrysis_carterae.AAC.2
MNQVAVHAGNSQTIKQQHADRGCARRAQCTDRLAASVQATDRGIKCARARRYGRRLSAWENPHADIRRAVLA